MTTTKSSQPYQEDVHPLDAIFKPRNIAVIGATEKPGSVGRTLVWNLMTSPFGGAVFPINPTKSSILGIKSHPRIADVADKVDLAVIVTPAATVPDLVAECVAAGVRGAIIISAGFKEVGPAGVALEARVLQAARAGNMRIIGPNCLGVMNTGSGLNATFAAHMARPGKVAFVSQSGALCTAVLDWSLREKVGFSHFVSIGSMLDVDWGDLIYYLGEDDRTRSIVMYVESIGNARSFMSAAREVSLSKPIIMIKPGRTEGAAKAAASHTGSLTGSDEVIDAALRRAGVLRVNNISDLFYMSEALAHQPRALGRRLTIVTNAGGPGVLASDALLAGGGELAQSSGVILEKLNATLPAAWSHSNPIDVLGDASAERYGKTIELAASDTASDGLLVILTPQAMTDPTLTATALAPYAHTTGKPVIASWMGGDDVASGEAILNQAGIPTFPYPDTAVRVFNHMWQYDENLRSLYETPSESDLTSARSNAVAEGIIAIARTERRELLTEAESKALLAAYGLPTLTPVVAAQISDAVAAADKLGYPVVLKLHSSIITHKTEVGGVQLDIKDAAGVRAAFELIRRGAVAHSGEAAFAGVTVQPMIKLSEGYELILGSSLDSQFGQVLLFGAGGQLVEVFKDHALGLPPLNTTLARRMLERTQIYKALQGVRGRAPVDMVGLERLLVQFSQLVVDQRLAIKEIDINPLFARPMAKDSMGAANSLLALDARVVLFPAGTTSDMLPRMAIRPYPTRFMWPITLKTGAEAIIRPIRSEDEPQLVLFHEQLSEHSVYLRYFSPLKLSTRISHERLSRICYNDYDREIALVVELSQSGSKSILAVGRLVKSRNGDEGEYGILVRDDMQRQGLGTLLLTKLVEVGRQEGLKRIRAEILPDNTGMRRASERVGFTVAYDARDGVVRSELTL